MFYRNTFISETPVYFKDPFKPAHHEPLEVKLRGHPQVKIHSQGIVKSLERSGRSPPGYGLHHRRFHFQKIFINQKPPDGLDDLTPQHKNLFHMIIHDQVHVPLTVPRLHVCQPVPFLRQRTQRFTEKNKSFCQDRQFPGSGTEKATLYADMISNVHQFEDRKSLIIYLVLSDICLYTPCPVLDVNK